MGKDTLITGIRFDGFTIDIDRYNFSTDMVERHIYKFDYDWSPERLGNRLFRIGTLMHRNNFIKASTIYHRHNKKLDQAEGDIT